MADQPPIVLDASCIIALVVGEPGAGTVEAALPGAVVSAVTLAEASGKMLRLGAEPMRVGPLLIGLGVQVEPFTLADAALSIQIQQLDDKRLDRSPPPHKRQRLSLGDRCCLALALRRGAEAMTSDQAWADLDDPVQVRLLIR